MSRGIYRVYNVEGGADRVKRVVITVNAHYKSAKLSAQTKELVAALEKTGFSAEIATSDSFFGGAECSADGVVFWDKDVLLARRLAKTARVFNAPESIEICDDKAATLDKLKGCGIAVPKTFVAPFTYPNIPYADFGFLEVAEKEIGYPMVLKHARSSLGMGVFLVNSRAEAVSIISDAARRGERVLIEEFVAESRGTDIRIIVIGGKAVSAMKRVNVNDFRSNVEQGGKGYKYVPTAEETEAVEKAARALKLDYAGVDVLATNGGAKIIEVNSNAFFGEISKVSGVNIAEKYADYIKECLY